MLIPLRTDRPPRRTPLVTQTLIVINLLVYLVGVSGTFFGLFNDPGVMAGLGHFDPRDFHWWQLITYQFVHDPYGILHIAFNMLFLWVFGAAVEDRMGRIGFAAFYVIGGAVAGLVHAVFNPDNPIIGASGSIAGVTGAFLALFPRSRIQIFIFFFFVGIISVPSLWFIGFYIAIDVLRQLGDFLGRGGSNVAYMAHLAGYVYGFAIGFVLLATRILKREEFDVFFLLTQARRRAEFRRSNQHGPAGVWDSAQADTGKRLARQAAKTPPPTPADEQRAELRARINRLLAAGDLGEAANLYRQLLAAAPAPPATPAARGRDDDHPDAALTATVLAEQGQLDVASQLYAEGAHSDAARAYELLIQNYPGSSKADEVRLILGLLYTRHLNLPQRARELIQQARPRLRDEGQSRLADQLLAELAT